MLTQACEKSNSVLVKNLLVHGLEKHDRSTKAISFGLTVMNAAALYSYIDVKEILLESEIDPNDRARSTASPASAKPPFNLLCESSNDRYMSQTLLD